jgi:hypothetical protein
METKINSEENTGGSMAMLSFYFLYGEPGAVVLIAIVRAIKR